MWPRNLWAEPWRFKPLLFAFAPLAWAFGCQVSNFKFQISDSKSEIENHKSQITNHLIRWLSLYVAYLFVQWWLLTHRIDRFWVPLIPVVALLAAVGVMWSERKLWRWASGAFLGLSVLQLGFFGLSLFNLCVTFFRKGFDGLKAFIHSPQTFQDH